MTEKQIYEDLRALHLSGMAECWKSLQETRKASSVSLKDGLALLLQSESTQRENKRTTRLLKKAKFRYNAIFEDVDFDSARGKDRDTLIALSTCDFIKAGRSVLVTGPAGTGKSFIATALGHQACLAGYSVAYFNMYKLMEQLTLARVESTIARFFDKLAAVDLVILDDFGMKKLDGQQLQDFMELIEDRHGRKSTMIASQLPVADWYDVLEKNATIADALLDRVARTSVRIELKGDSLRR